MKLLIRSLSSSENLVLINGKAIINIQKIKVFNRNQSRFLTFSNFWLRYRSKLVITKGLSTHLTNSN